MAGHVGLQRCEKLADCGARVGPRCAACPAAGDAPLPGGRRHCSRRSCRHPLLLLLLTLLLQVVGAAGHAAAPAAVSGTAVRRRAVHVLQHVPHLQQPGQGRVKGGPGCGACCWYPAVAPVGPIAVRNPKPQTLNPNPQPGHSATQGANWECSFKVCLGQAILLQCLPGGCNAVATFDWDRQLCWKTNLLKGLLKSCNAAIRQCQGVDATLNPGVASTPDQTHWQVEASKLPATQPQTG
eukprot:359013-Chlamydomonas_euryale.AAC.4